MEQFDMMKAMEKFWGSGTQSFLDVQQSFFKAMASSAPNLATPNALQPDMEALGAAQAAFADAWSSAQAVSSSFFNGLSGAGPEKLDPTATDVLAKIFDPRGWLTATSEIDEALNRLAEGPRLADLWNVERKFGALFTAWAALRRRNLEHNAIMLQAWTRATGVFSKAMNERARTGKVLESSREVMALWVEIANDVLLETQRTDAFLQSQREMLKTSTDLRLAQQEIAEFYSQMFGYPTRGELDDVHRNLTELRREVRKLVREERSRKKAEAASA